MQLKEQLRECEVEKERIVEQLKFLEAQKNVTVVAKTGENLDIEKTTMNVNEMLRYKATIVGNLEEVERDLRTLSAEEVACVSTIDSLHV